MKMKRDKMLGNNKGKLTIKKCFKKLFNAFYKRWIVTAVVVGDIFYEIDIAFIIESNIVDCFSICFVAAVPVTEF